MKKVILFLFLITLLKANEEVFELEKFNFSMENDANVDTDIGYTHGARVSFLFYRGDTENSILNIPFTSFNKTNNFISFAYANQMFTPYDLEQVELIKDDRPYAGYSYLEIGLHQTTKTDLDSLTLQTGVVGPSSGMEDLQALFHESIDARDAAGWSHQLDNQFILQLNYMHKWRLELPDLSNMQTLLIPYTGLNLGNASVKASAGAQYRVGFNIAKDFGTNSMNEGSFSSLPTQTRSLTTDISIWSLCLNLTAGTNLVAKDIFLDDWYEIQRNNLNAYASAGITARYENFSIDYQHNYYTKDYEQRGKYKDYKGYGFLILTYSFK